jgi:hypothetical protein
VSNRATYPYEGSADSRPRRRKRSSRNAPSFRGWTRTSEGKGSEPCRGHQHPTRNRGACLLARTESLEIPLTSPGQGSRYPCGRRESNPQSTSFEPARSSSCLTSAWCAARGSNSVLRIKGPVHHPSCLRRVDRPGFEPGTFSVRGSCSNQLELAAQGLPGLARRAATTGLTGACTPVNRPVLFFGVPLWICQHAGTFIPQDGANENRPPGVCPASGFRLVLTPLSRSHSSDQGSIGLQAREHADMPLASPAPYA